MPAPSVVQRHPVAACFTLTYAISWPPLLIPPGAVLSVLFCLKAFVSMRFASNVFPAGILFWLQEIGWVYVHTNSVLLSQLLHASSTGSQVVFGPPYLAASQEAFWYAAYAGALWLAVGIVIITFGGRLAR
jgi:hypothetical protein